MQWTRPTPLGFYSKIGDRQESDRMDPTKLLIHLYVNRITIESHNVIGSRASY